MRYFHNNDVTWIWVSNHWHMDHTSNLHYYTFLSQWLEYPPPQSVSNTESIISISWHYHVAVFFYSDYEDSYALTIQWYSPPGIHVCFNGACFISNQQHVIHIWRIWVKSSPACPTCHRASKKIEQIIFTKIFLMQILLIYFFMAKHEGNVNPCQNGSLSICLQMVWGLSATDLFPRLQLIISHYWLRKWLCAKQAQTI